MTEKSQHPSEKGGVSIALVVTFVLHVAVFVSSVLIRLQEPPQSEKAVQLSFRRTVLPAAKDSKLRSAPRLTGRERIASAARKQIPRRNSEALPALRSVVPRVSDLVPPVSDLVQADVPARSDSLADPGKMTLRSVLERPLSAEQAWDILSTLLEEHPEFSDTVLREMIAGSGYVPDSLPPVNLYLDQIFKNGIPPTWDRQRGAVEHAFRSFDPVQGWTNKGGYGPQINVIGLIKFLLDLIEGE